MWSREIGERFLRQIECSLVLADPPEFGRMIGTIRQICREYAEQPDYNSDTAIYAPLAELSIQIRGLEMLEREYRAIYVVDALRLRQDELLDNRRVGNAMCDNICSSILSWCKVYAVPRVMVYPLFAYPRSKRKLNLMGDGNGSGATSPD